MYNNVPNAGFPDEGTGGQTGQFGDFEQPPQEQELLLPQDQELLLPQEQELLPPQEQDLLQDQEQYQPVGGQEQVNETNQNIEQDTNGEQQATDSSTPSTWRPGDWKCSKCSDHNFASRVMCRACGAPKDGVQDTSASLPDNWRPGDWKCSYCGDHQFASRMYCRQCDAPKGAAAPREASQRPPDPNKVYVGNLNTGTTEEALRETMSKFGEVKDCYILGQKGNHKGFGFVVFETPEAVKAAMAADVDLDGNKLKIEKSLSRRDDGYGGRRETQVAPNKLYIGKISDGTTKEELKDYFSQFGEVTEAILIGDRGFGFVTFQDQAAAQTAMSADLELNGSQLSAEKARPKRPDPYDDYPPYPRGGYGRRGGRYDDYYDSYRGGRYDDYYNNYSDYDDRYRRRSRGPPPPWARGPPRGWSPPRRRRW